MQIRTECANPECRRPYKISRELVGKNVTCKQCQKSFTVLALDDTSVDTSVAAKSLTPLKTTDRNVPHRLGRFEIQEQLGGGAFGVVYRAFDPQLERQVALKVPRPEILEKPGAVARFLVEAKAAARLHHPNIVPIFDAGRDNHQYYIASEFIPGCPLDGVVESGPLELQRAARIVQQLAEAFDYAHRQGIIHRDIKPANVMLDDEDQPHVLDFGLARFDMTAANLTHDHAVMGTPSYMSPEQAAGDNPRVNKVSDQYSLGILFYELLTGQTPFSGPIEIVIYNVLHTPPKSPSDLNRQIPRDLETICLKAIAKEPERRYGSCHELAEDLRRWRQDEPITARRASYVERLIRWCRRNPLVAGLTVTAAILLIAVAGISTISAIRLKDLAERERNETIRANTEKANALELANTNAALAEKERAAHVIAEQNLYTSYMSLVKSAWENSQGGRVVELLNRWQPLQKGTGDRPDKPLTANGGSTKDLRGFEWYYWNRLAHSYLLDLSGSFIRCAYSADSKWLATSQMEGAYVDGVWRNSSTVAVWNAATGESRITLKGQGNSLIHTLVFNPDATLLAFTEAPVYSSNIESAEVKVWDLTHNRQLHAFSVPAKTVFLIAFSPDGKQFAAGYHFHPSGITDSECKIWDTTTGQERMTFKIPSRELTGRTPGVSAAGLAYTPNVTIRKTETIDFSADGKRILSVAANGSATEWDTANGQSIRTLQQSVTRVAMCVFSRDRTRFAIATSNGIVKVCDANSSDAICSVSLPAAASVSLNSNGTRMATVANQEISIWDVANSQKLFTLRGYSGTLNSIDFSPNGKRLATVSSDGSLKIWDTTREQESLMLRNRSQKDSGVASNPVTKQQVIPGRQQPVTVFDAITGDETVLVRQSIGKAQRSAFDSVGNRIASSGDGTEIQVRDVANGQLIRELKGHTGSITAMVFSRDGKKLASSSLDKTVRIWDSTAGKIISIFRGHDSAVGSVAFSPDGAQVASVGTQEKMVRLWDAMSGKEIRNLQTDEPRLFFTDLAFSPDGSRVAVGDTMRQLHFWDATIGTETLIQTGHSTAVTSVAYSPDGKRLASASSDRTIKLWDTATLEETLMLKGTIDQIVSVAFSSDGQRLAAANRDGTVIRWDAKPWDAESRLEDQALNLIRFAIGQGLYTEGISADLYNDGTITSNVRERAIQLLGVLDDKIKQP